MEPSPGVRLARLMIGGFTGMADEVVAELARRGHPGVTPTLEFALVAIDGGARDASALGRATGVSKQAAAKTVTTLEQLGYVRREADAADARRRHLTVTDRGHEMSAIGAGLFDDIRRRWVDEVGEARAADAETALSRLLGEAPTTDQP